MRKHRAVEKCSDFSRLVAQRNVTEYQRKKGEAFPERIDTRAVLVLRLNQRGRKMEI